MLVHRAATEEDHFSLVIKKIFFFRKIAHSNQINLSLMDWYALNFTVFSITAFGMFSLANLFLFNLFQGKRSMRECYI